MASYVHGLVSGVLFYVVSFIVEVFGLRCMSSYIGLSSVVLLSSAVSCIGCINIEVPCCIGFYVDLIIVVVIISWSSLYVLLYVVSSIGVFIASLLIVVILCVFAISGLSCVVRIDIASVSVLYINVVIISAFILVFTMGPIWEIV